MTKVKIKDYNFDSQKNSVIATVEYKGKVFEKLNLKPYPKRRNCKTCTHSCCDGYNCEFVVRFWDCEKNKTKLLIGWNILTAIPLILMLYCCFKKGLDIFNTFSFLLVAWVIMDIFCYIIEEKIVSKIYENKSLKKLERLEKVTKEENEKKEALEQLAKEEKIREDREKIPYYTQIESAQNFVNLLTALTNEYDFKNNKKSIKLCISKFNEYLEQLKIDSSGYMRVAYIFEVYLPEFYRTLELYSNYIKADTVTEEKEEKLSITIDEFYRFFSRNKADVIYDSKDVDSKFQESSDNLVNLIKKEMR